ncbi:Putative oligomeric Golgi complex subunit 8 protein [Septoria linicola]|uniref:Conserved oligomeric Golgi complex subunit 8 n=1 Tax=Septoria linicola TaxID=215465 RepID=A0A9Q9AQQ3_9PEZI|nr:putative oligomeric Golgi complex subunit 8 protein [Septoria linicola]USW53360.1 Putative oligomeric Golgi complex subunit 8 protein [Septoria linicola]
MADHPVLELLAPYFDQEAAASPSARDPQTGSYLSRLSTLSLADLTASEPASLLQSAQSHLRNLQALSKRSHKAVISSSAHLVNLTSLLPEIGSQAEALSTTIPELETAATEFAEKYDRSTDNAVLDRRKRAALLSRNVDRVSDVLDLPNLLSSTVTAAQAGGSGSTTVSGGAAATSYASALDLHSHIKRLKALYPQSDLVGDISAQSEVEMQNMATILITSLQSPTLKLAAAMRAIGWLRRVAPDLAEDKSDATRANMLSTKALSLSINTVGNDGALGTLFLICRLRTLHETLGALEPLRDLADQETAQRKAPPSTNGKAKSATEPSQTMSSGTQSERYLKRYIEIFREQSFNILSMFKSIFPSNLPQSESNANASDPVSSKTVQDSLLPLPSPVSTFAFSLVDMLEATLREYMPNVADKASRESLLTQVLYCAGSLGRLGADFGMMIALLEDDLDESETHDNDVNAAVAGCESEPEWVQVMKKHRIQASRLEVLAKGVGTTRKASAGIMSPIATSPGATPSLAV